MAPPVPASSPDHERGLLAAIARGDEAAFAQFYDRFSALLWSMAMRMLQDPTEAEDVVQETFTYVWKKAAHYNPALSQPSTWICLILRNRCLDQIRSRQRRERLTNHVKAQPSASHFSTASPVQAMVEMRELGSRAREAMSRIPDMQRQMLELAFFGGRSHSQIATETGLPLGTVKTLIRQGLLFLRGHMEGAHR